MYLCMYLYSSSVTVPHTSEVSSLQMVLSGHGGARAAEYVKQNLFSNLIKHPKFISDTKSAIGYYSLADCTCIVQLIMPY